MALTCDFCGERVTEVEQVAFGHNEGVLRNCSAGEWFYYCDAECADAVKQMLRDLATWAHEGKDSGFEWRLVGPVTEEPSQAPDEATAAIESVKEDRTPDLRTAEGVELLPDQGPVGQEYRERSQAGTSLRKLRGITPRAAQALRRGDLVTLEEVGQRSEAELRAISGVGPNTLKTLKAALAKRGLSLRDCEFDLAETGDSLRAFRIGAELSQYELGRMMEPPVAQAEVSNWEKGRHLIPEHYRGQLADALKVTPDDLLVRTQ